MSKGKEFWQEVRRAYESGEGSYQTLGERFGVNRQTILLHSKKEGWIKNRKKRVAIADMQEVTGKLSEAAMREIGRLEEQETDVKTIRDLAALVKELNQLVKNTEESAGESVLRVQWGEETELWSE